MLSISPMLQTPAAVCPASDLLTAGWLQGGGHLWCGGLQEVACLESCFGDF